MTQRLFYLVLLGAACVPEPKLPLAYRSENFEYFSNEPGESVPGSSCVDSLDYFEHHWRVHSELLGLPAKAPTVIQYFQFQTFDELRRAGCALQGSTRVVDGCFESSGRILTVSKFFAHELFHAYTSFVGRPPRFWVEGIAMYLDCSNRGLVLYDGAAALSNAEMMFREDTFSAKLREVGLAEPYTAAMSLVAFLIEEHGMDRFLSFYREAKWNEPANVVQSKFEAAFGATEEVLTRWRTASRGRTIRAVCAAECASPVFEPTASVVPRCEVPDPRGLVRGQVRSLVTTTRQTVQLTVESPGSCSSTVSIDACDERSTLPRMRTASTTANHPRGATADIYRTELEPGRYFLEWTSRCGAEPVGLRTELGPPASAAEQCSLPFPNPVDPKVDEVRFVAAAGSAAARSGSIAFATQLDGHGFVTIPTELMEEGYFFLDGALADGGSDICRIGERDTCGLTEAPFISGSPDRSSLCTCPVTQTCEAREGFGNDVFSPILGSTVSAAWESDGGREIALTFRVVRVRNLFDGGVP